MQDKNLLLFVYCEGHDLGGGSNKLQLFVLGEGGRAGGPAKGGQILISCLSGLRRHPRQEVGPPIVELVFVQRHNAINEAALSSFYSI